MPKKDGDKSELLTKEEMNNLLDTVSNNIYFTTLYQTLKILGRRIGEIYGTYRNKKLVGGIKVQDIDFKENTIETVILKTKKRKIKCNKCNEKVSYKHKFCPYCTNKLQEIDKNKLKYDITKKIIISIKPELHDILKKFIKEKNLKKNDYIFREWSLKYIQKQIKIHIKAAKITKNFSLHGFRHYFITQCKIAGLSNEDIAKWTGHIRPETLNIYDRRISKDVEDKIMKVEL